jgi:hypothetical protein
MNSIQGSKFGFERGRVVRLRRNKFEEAGSFWQCGHYLRGVFVGFGRYRPYDGPLRLSDLEDKMSGFGKKNVRSHDLRKLMIYAAAEIFEKEISAQRQANRDEIHAIVKSVCVKRDMPLSDLEFSSVVAGTKRLATNRRYIEGVVAKWSDGRVALGFEDIKQAGDILGDTGSEGRGQFRPLGA